MTTNQPKNLPPFRLIDRFTDWSGWETLYEHRRKVFGITFLVVALILGCVWLIARSQTSLLRDTFEAEAIVETLTTPADESAATGKESERLFLLAEQKKVLTRFCGTLAQEDLLKQTPPLTQKYFNALEEKLLTQKDPELYLIAKAAASEPSVALVHIENVLSSIKEQKRETSFIFMYTYLLIQKAKILSNQGTSPSEAIDELSKIFSTNQDVTNFFENWLHCSTNDFLNSLRKK